MNFKKMTTLCNSKNIAILILIPCLLLGSFSIGSKLGLGNLAVEENDRIYIYGNVELAEYCSTGDGTLVNPYYISNMNFTEGLELWGTDAYVTIDNCVFSGMDSDGSLYLYQSSNIKIINNEFSNCKYGVYFYLSTFNNVSYNSFDNCMNAGINLHINCDSNIFQGNVISGKGFELMTSQNLIIDSENLIDGKPIFFLQDVNDFIVVGNNTFSQVIIINCDNITLTNFTLENLCTGIYLHNSNLCNITNNWINCYENIVIDSCDNCTVASNFLEGIFTNIYLRFAKGCTVINNIIESGDFGIVASQVWDLVVINNTISNTETGFNLGAAYSGTVIENNTLYICEVIYFELSYSDDIIITKNTFYYAMNRMFIINSSVTNMVVENNTHIILIPNTPTFTTENTITSESSISINWTSEEIAESYDIYLNGTFLTSVTENSYRFSPTVIGDYIFKIKAKNVHGLSDFSEELTITFITPESNNDSSNIPGYSLFLTVIFTLGIIMVGIKRIHKQGHRLNN